MNKIGLSKKLILASYNPITAANALLMNFFCKHNINHAFKHPLKMTFHVTENCNCRCSHCVVGNSRKLYSKDMPFDDWKSIIDQVKRYSPYFYITGGEPLLYPDIIRLLSYISKNRIIAGLTTNGILLRKYAEQLTRSGLKFISISIDGNKKIHDSGRGVKGVYDRAVDGIKELVKQKGSSLFPNIKINCVISNRNVDKLESIIKLASNLKINEIAFQHYSFYTPKLKDMCNNYAANNNFKAVIHGSYEQKPVLNKKGIKTLQSFLKRKQSLERKHNINIIFRPDVSDVFNYYSETYLSKKSFCLSPFNSMCIRSDGTAELCNGYVLGNIKETSIKELFNSDKAKHLRTILKHDKIMPFCFRCSDIVPKFEKE